MAPGYGYLDLHKEVCKSFGYAEADALRTWELMQKSASKPPVNRRREAVLATRKKRCPKRSTKFRRWLSGIVT